MRYVMEIDNITIDPNDDIHRNYLIVQQGDGFPDRELDQIEGPIWTIECNKHLGFSCLEALHLDGREL